MLLFLLYTIKNVKRNHIHHDDELLTPLSTSVHEANAGPNTKNKNLRNIS